MGVAGFDTTQPGTALQHWVNFLADRPRWMLPDRAPTALPLVVVAPHPDDETLGAGGLIHTWINAGRRVTVVSVTDGEASHPWQGGLRNIRQRELRRALEQLGGSTIMRLRLGLPDGRVRCWSRSLHALLRPLFRHAVVVAPFERDGHPDHDAVGWVCRQLAAEQSSVLARYPIWAWHHASPQHLIDSTWVRFPLSAPAHRAKMRAIRCFESQIDGRHRVAILPPPVLQYFEQTEEAFIL